MKGLPECPKCRGSGDSGIPYIYEGKPQGGNLPCYEKPEGTTLVYSYDNEGWIILNDDRLRLFQDARRECKGEYALIRRWLPTPALRVMYDLLLAGF